jgi:threonine/homoserine/homoserine lactone efflux protein
MTDRLLGFAGVCVLLTFVPGVDTAVVTRSALARGTRAGVRRLQDRILGGVLIALGARLAAERA